MDESMNLDNGHDQVKIDEDLHSRQLAVYGRESMSRMANANVLILGLKGLGVEVGAKPIGACERSGRAASFCLPGSKLPSDLRHADMLPACICCAQRGAHACTCGLSCQL